MSWEIWLSALQLMYPPVVAGELVVAAAMVADAGVGIRSPLELTTTELLGWRMAAVLVTSEDRTWETTVVELSSEKTLATINQ